jgi:hypothetical protein
MEKAVAVALTCETILAWVKWSGIPFDCKFIDLELL